MAESPNDELHATAIAGVLCAVYALVHRIISSEGSVPLRVLSAACIWVSGIVALGFGWWGEPTTFVRAASLPTATFAAIVVAIHLIAAAAIVAGSLFFTNIVAARMTSLSTAVAWLLMAAVLGGGMTWPLAAVTMLSSLAGLLGFLPSLADGPSTSSRPRRESVSTLRSFRPPRRERSLPFDRVAAAQSHGPQDDTEDHSRPYVPIPSWPVPEVDGSPLKYRTDRTRTKIRPRGGRRRKARVGEVIAGSIALLIVLFGASFVGYLVWSASEPRAGVSTGEPTSRPASELAEAATPPAGLPSLPNAFSTQTASAPAVRTGSSARASVSLQVSSIELPPLQPVTATPAASALTADFATPGEYCASVVNVDDPDPAKVSGGIQDLFVQARVAAKTSQGDVHWRCMDGEIWVCATPTGGLACEKIPSSVDRVLICAAHPDAKGIRTAGGDWSCDAFTPVVTPAQLQAPDRRGYDKQAWHKLAAVPG